MKNIGKIVLVTGFLITISIGQTYSQQRKCVPKLLPLIHPDLHAGCYISNEAITFAELSADSIFFDIRGFDEVFAELRNVKIYPGYNRGFTKGGYSIYVRAFEGLKEGFLRTIRYKMLIIHKNKLYHYNLKGFCCC